MVFGTFDVRVDTVKTFKRGVVALSGGGGKLTVRIDVDPFDKDEFEGSYDGKDFRFEMDALLDDGRRLTGTFEGNVWGNSIEAIGQTNIGKIEVLGTSISTSTGDSGDKPGSMYAGRWSDGY